MEVTQSDAQPAEDHPPSARFTWTIDNFWRLDVKKLYSDVFFVGGYKWRVLIFPKGNNVDHLSVYLDVADSRDLPYGWNRHAHFSLSIVNQIHRNDSIEKETIHQFNAREADWGFTKFIPLAELNDPGRGYLINGTCIIEAHVDVKLVKGQEEEEKKLREEAKAHPSAVEKEPNFLAETTKSSPFSEMDNVFDDIRKILEGQKTSEAATSSRFYPLSSEEVANAKKTIKECFGTNLASVIESMQTPELKNALSVMLACNAFPGIVAGELTEFLAKLDQSCEQYSAAKQEQKAVHRAVHRNESLIAELKTSMTKVLSEFTPLRDQAEAVGREIVELERALSEKKEKKASLTKSLEELADRATTSKQALVIAEQDMKLSLIKKERAEKMFGDMERSWESLKAGCSSLL